MVKLFIWNMTLLFALLGLSHAYAQQTTPKQLVFDYCNNSRLTDMTSEQTCGDLQDFYHMEFLCVERNQSPTNYCWVEEK